MKDRPEMLSEQREERRDMLQHPNKKKKNVWALCDHHKLFISKNGHQTEAGFLHGLIHVSMAVTLCDFQISVTSVGHVYI